METIRRGRSSRRPSDGPCPQRVISRGESGSDSPRETIRRGSSSRGAPQRALPRKRTTPPREAYNISPGAVKHFQVPYNTSPGCTTPRAVSRIPPRASSTPFGAILTPSPIQLPCGGFLTPSPIQLPCGSNTRSIHDRSAAP
eukprot:8304716-Pyramimonas_sp.AAC.1